MKKLKLLVFPCGSEIGLEVFRSLQYSRHIELWGASSVSDHGQFVYYNYIGGIPNISDSKFITKFKETLQENQFDAVYPAMDSVIVTLKKHEKTLKCKIISSDKDVVEICQSKELTYKKLNGIIETPKVYKSNKFVKKYPVFIKPIYGYGSRGAKIIYNMEDGISHLKEWPESIITEYLPGQEFTVDCFTKSNGKLLFAGPRPRRRTKMGISVNTVSIPKKERGEFCEIAKKINSALSLKGAWFFQVKRSKSYKLVLLEVASRLGGSSSLYRMKGINFALLTVFDAFNYDVEIFENKIDIELDRALDCVYKINFFFNKVYVDFDDCLIIENQVNTQLLARIFEFINAGKKIVLLTKHDSDINQSLINFRLINIFDQVIHIKKSDNKADYIKEKNAIFIDDSYKERHEVYKSCGIPVFAPDMIGNLKFK